MKNILILLCVIFCFGCKDNSVEHQAPIIARPVVKKSLAQQWNEHFEQQRNEARQRIHSNRNDMESCLYKYSQLNKEQYISRTTTNGRYTYVTENLIVTRQMNDLLNHMANLQKQISQDEALIYANHKIYQ